jgi:hypothetical protein
MGITFKAVKSSGDTEKPDQWLIHAPTLVGLIVAALLIGCLGLGFGAAGFSMAGNLQHASPIASPPPTCDKPVSVGELTYRADLANLGAGHMKGPTVSSTTPWSRSYTVGISLNENIAYLNVFSNVRIGDCSLTTLLCTQWLSLGFDIQLFTDKANYTPLGSVSVVPTMVTSPSSYKVPAVASGEWHKIPSRKITFTVLAGSGYGSLKCVTQVQIDFTVDPRKITFS